MFASFEENSKIQCGDGEGTEPFLLSSAAGFCGFCKISPSQPSKAVSSCGAEAPRGGREQGWRQRAAPEIGASLWPQAKCCCPFSCRPPWLGEGRGPTSLQPPLLPSQSSLKFGEYWDGFGLPPPPYPHDPTSPWNSLLST